MIRLRHHLIASAFVCAASPVVAAEAARTVTVATPAEYAAVAKELRAGDTVILKNGVWRDFDIDFTGQGTEAAPITLRAETPGKVILSGQSALRLGGDYLLVSGLVFRDGYSPRDEVIAFRSGKRLATHSRVTETVVDRFNKPRVAGANPENDIWIALFGRDNRFDHNHVEGKITPGVTLAVRIEDEVSQQNRHRIDHTYFGPRPPLGANGGETIRIGTSHNSLSDSLTVVESNLFEGCSGEVEIISVKSGGNVVRGNLFNRSQGTVTLRHGNGNLVEGNVFFGGGEANTGGVRVINANQTVRNNVFVGLTGTGFASAFTIMNGVPNSVLNRYHQVKNADIHHNTFVEVSDLLFGGGADAERTLPAIDSRFHDNLIIGKSRIKVLADMSGVAFSDNVISAGVQSPLPGFAAGEVRADIAKGLTLPKITAPAGAGAPRDLTVLDRDSTGVSWYPKANLDAKVSTRMIKVTTTDGLTQAMATAQSGDVLNLSAGVYKIGPVTVKTAVTLRGAATVEGAFTLANTGDLTLDGLTLTGEGALIRATPSNSGHNYHIALNKITVTNVTGPVVAADDGVFIASIDISHSTFSNLDTPVVALSGEQAVKGGYKAEIVRVTDSRFANLKSPALDILRGGRDESTFGPRITLTGNRFETVSVPAHLHGATAVTLERNAFINSGAVTFVREAGAPVITVDGVALTVSDAARHFDYTNKK
ncbi:polysaccharide lyase 6 family protein [Asticcacaulis sp. YBE204]|uniref:polysaccharide lyase 6 family protein n=1 Tax=Asticcacaulis sp. YBE204 TaxID=1282363 RepID=UPI0003C3F3FC|nr:polysaccharide lyase 6 family protein [Asticcacaulis sp. YBE204]ESQ78350.1 hypothetical protein AEYBE204_14355 [Asticcacaulis sp. YBE204]